MGTRELDPMVRAASRAIQRRKEKEKEAAKPPEPQPLKKTAIAVTKVSERSPSASDLVDLVGDHGDLFLDGNGRPHVSTEVHGKSETWALSDLGFKGWLGSHARLKLGRAPKKDAVSDATEQLAAEATYSGTVREVYVRYAFDGGVIYLDLGDDERRVVEVTATEWRIVESPPVRFRRPRRMLPIPVPLRGGSLDPFLQSLNLDTESMALTQAFLLGTLQPTGTHAIFDLHGEQGSGKTMMARLVKMLVDPNRNPLRSPPREEVDLLVAAADSRVIAYDNISTVSDWLSDGLCRLASGGAISKRRLYSDADEFCVEAKRPIILNGIEELAVRGDLLDRTIVVNLPRMRTRKTEVEVLAEFEKVRQGALGALLDAAVMGLRDRAKTRIGDLPRLADFATWNAAGAPSLGTSSDAFLIAYRAHRRDTSSLALDADAVGGAVVALMESGDFSGIVGELLGHLEAKATPGVLRSRAWPKTPRDLAGHLRRLAPDLRSKGIEVVVGKRKPKGVPVTLSRLAAEGGASC